jgi:hypothetical protein
MSDFIFYSWQSDLLPKFNRYFIGKAIERAIKDLSAELRLEEAQREISLHFDEGTQGVPGSPDIASTILEKIDRCRVFVADLTFVGTNQGGESLPNPNVLIEYGYALKSKGSQRIIGVLNTTYGVPENLPFDLRHKRVTVRYEARPDDSAEKLRSSKEKLTQNLKRTLRPSLLATKYTRFEQTRGL